MGGLLTDVLLLVVATAFGGVDGNRGHAAGTLVALVFVGTGCTVFVSGFAMR